MKSHKNLDVWKKAIDLSVEVYRLSNSFPNDERYGMTSQMRRAVVSIASNIAEGAARRTDKDFFTFYIWRVVQPVNSILKSRLHPE